MSLHHEMKRHFYFTVLCLTSALQPKAQSVILLSVSVPYGSWFDHIKGWSSQTATMNNLLHITYEEMSLVKEN